MLAILGTRRRTGSTSARIGPNDRATSMVPALALITVLSWGTWIPVAQSVRGVEQRIRTFYVTIGNLVFAAAALLVAGGHISIGWRGFWLPFAGGMLWTAGNFCAFRATEAIGLARAAGTWTPLNIIVAFVWGATVFGELSHFDAARYAVLVLALMMVFSGVALIVASQDVRRDDRPGSGPDAAGARPITESLPQPGSARRSVGRRGLLWAIGAGLLWGTYFVPAQWAHVPAQVGNFPLAIGMFVAGLALALPAGHAVKLSSGVTSVEMTAGALWGIGNLALLGLVARIGTGAGFTIAQLSLLVNASIGIWIFKVPKPGTSAARTVLAGVVIAGIGGAVIGAIS